MTNTQKKALSLAIELMSIDMHPVYSVLDSELNKSSLTAEQKRLILSAYQEAAYAQVKKPINEAKVWIETILSDEQ